MGCIVASRRLALASRRGRSRWARATCARPRSSGPPAPGPPTGRPQTRPSRLSDVVRSPRIDFMVRSRDSDGSRARPSERSRHQRPPRPRPCAPSPGHHPPPAPHAAPRWSRRHSSAFFAALRQKFVSEPPAVKKTNRLALACTLLPLTAGANNFTSSAKETGNIDDASCPVACRTGCHVGDGLHHHGGHTRIHPAHEHRAVQGRWRDVHRRDVPRFRQHQDRAAAVRGARRRVLRWIPLHVPPELMSLKRRHDG